MEYFPTICKTRWRVKVLMLEDILLHIKTWGDQTLLGHITTSSSPNMITKIFQIDTNMDPYQLISLSLTILCDSQHCISFHNHIWVCGHICVLFQ